MNFRPAPTPDFDPHRHSWSAWNDHRNEHRRARYHGQMTRYYVFAKGFRNFFYLRKADVARPDRIARLAQTSLGSFPVHVLPRLIPYKVRTPPDSGIGSFSRTASGEH